VWLASRTSIGSSAWAASFETRGTTNHREDLLQYRVERRADLVEVVIPFFRENPLLTSKRHDFDAFARCMELVSAGRHLVSEGLIDIVEIAQTMNRQKPRHDLLRILRGHTPEVQDTGS
jgi:LAGLIDADG endonuclease